MRAAIYAASAPAVWAAPQAIRAGQFVFASGQIPIDPVTGELVIGDITAQTRQVLLNVGEVLKAAGISYQDVVRTNVYLVDLEDFAAMNAVYATFFTAPPPARSTVQVARLPRDARVEIEFTAILTT